MTPSFETTYPTVAYFVHAIGWIEIGDDYDSPLTSFIRAIHPGGMIWEGEDKYESMEAAFQDLEEGIAEWMREEGIDME